MEKKKKHMTKSHCSQTEITKKKKKKENTFWKTFSVKNNNKKYNTIYMTLLSIMIHQLVVLGHFFLDNISLLNHLIFLVP